MLTVLKGLGLGLFMLFALTLVYFWASGMLGTHGAVGVGAARSLTIGSMLYWIAAALLLALGVVIVLMWPTKVSG